MKDDGGEKEATESGTAETESERTIAAQGAEIVTKDLANGETATDSDVNAALVSTYEIADESLREREKEAARHLQEKKKRGQVTIDTSSSDESMKSATSSDEGEEEIESSEDSEEEQDGQTQVQSTALQAGASGARSDAPAITAARKAPQEVVTARKNTPAQTWTLSDEVLADMKCTCCSHTGKLRPSGRYRIDPVRGPQLKCRQCTRTYQGRRVLSLLSASAHSPTVFTALKTAEEWVAENTKAIAAKRAAEVPVKDWIGLATKKHRSSLRCTNCNAKGRIQLFGGHTQGERAIRCAECKKKYVAEAAEHVLNMSVGSDWKDNLEQPRQSSSPTRTRRVRSQTATRPRRVIINQDEQANSMPRITTATRIQDVPSPPAPHVETNGTVVGPPQGLRGTAQKRGGPANELDTMDTDSPPMPTNNQSSMIHVSKQQWEQMVKSLSEMATAMGKFQEQNQRLEEQNRRLEARFEQLARHQAGHQPAAAVHARLPEYETVQRAAAQWPALAARPRRDDQSPALRPDNNTQSASQTRSWSEVARQQRMETLPDPQRQALHATMHALEVHNLKRDRSPAVDVVYTRDIRRAPLGQIRRSLQHGVPASALLGLSFIGGSILEIVTLKSQKQNLVETLRLLGVQPMPNFCMTDDALKKQTSTLDADSREKENLDRIIRRMQRCVGNSRNSLATRWYAAQLEKANTRLAEIEQPAQAADTPRDGHQTSESPQATAAGERSTDIGSATVPKQNSADPETVNTQNEVEETERPMQSDAVATVAQPEEDQDVMELIDRAPDIQDPMVTEAPNEQSTIQNQGSEKSTAPTAAE